MYLLWGKSLGLQTIRDLYIIFFSFCNDYMYFRFPSRDALYTIYSSILTQHLKNPVNKFNGTVLKLGDLIVQLAINFHDKILTVFLPTAIKFHYIFNLRDMSNVFQVISYSVPN